jgi:hypothetical protein
MPNPDDDDLIQFLVDSADLEDLDDASELDEDLGDAGDEDGGADESDTVVDDEIGDTEDPVSAALRPGAPLLLLHRSHQHSKLLPTVISDASRRHAGALHIGVVASMPRMSPTGLRDFLSKTADAPVRIADPEAFARLDSFGPVLSGQRDGKPYVGLSTQPHWQYFTETQPSGGTDSWVRATLAAQRNAGATVLLTPGVWLDPATSAGSLDTMRQHAEWAQSALEPGEHLAVNITMPASWLTTPALRNRLLDEIVDMDHEVFYLRVRWPLMAQPYGQLLNPGILDGYVQVANVFEENDKVLLLPNTGLTGWVALAWGAHGFSTGIGSGERAFAETRVIKIKQSGPRPAPTHRTFAASVLHTTDVATAARLDAVPNAQPCTCRFCRTLRRLPSGQFSKELAGAHYLRRVADLTAATTTHSRGRRVATRQTIRSARRFISGDASVVPLTGVNDPKHLPLWADRLG